MSHFPVAFVDTGHTEHLTRIHIDRITPVHDPKTNAAEGSAYIHACVCNVGVICMSKINPWRVPTYYNPADGQCFVHTHDLHWSQQVLRSWFQQRPAKSCCSWQHARVHHQVSRHILRQKYVSEHVVRMCLFAKC